MAFPHAIRMGHSRHGYASFAAIVRQLTHRDQDFARAFVRHSAVSNEIIIEHEHVGILGHMTLEETKNSISGLHAANGFAGLVMSELETQQGSVTGLSLRRLRNEHNHRVCMQPIDLRNRDARACISGHDIFRRRECSVDDATPGAAGG